MRSPTSKRDLRFDWSSTIIDAKGTGLHGDIHAGMLGPTAGGIWMEKFSGLNLMTMQSCLCFAAFLCWPLLLTAQQAGSPANAAPQSEQTPRPGDPILLNRPAAKQAHSASAITPEGSIHLDAVVTDGAGKPASGLEPPEFKLFDNGQASRILSFRSVDGIAVKPNPPVEIILLIDTANLPFEQVAFTRKEVETFLHENDAHLAQPVSIMLLTDAGLRVQPRPSVDGNALASVLGQIKGGIHTINAAMGVDGEVERFQLSLRAISTIAENEVRKPGRKLLIWVGPGWPMLDSRTFTFSEKEQRRYFDEIVELTTRLREGRMVVYSVSAPEPGLGGGPDRRFLYQDYLKGVTSERKADTGNLALKVLVMETGGRIFGPDNELAKQIDRCIAEANGFYTISFNPAHAEHADEYHDLKVEVLHPGFTARTMTGYYNQPQADAKDPEYK